jgi:hypothetical protein
MEIKLGQIQKAQGAMSKLINMFMPIKVAFKVSRLAKAVNELLTTVEEQRKKLVEKLGKQQEDGSFTVTPNNVATFQEEFSSLLDETVELEWEPMSFGDLGDIKLSAVDVLNLEPFFTE